MFNKKILAASMAAAITTGGMVAQSHALEVTNNNVGQVLLGPAFYAEGGYETDITVTNTRTDSAVKAKIVFRSHKDSHEVLDFFLFLSPGDVWRGKVVGKDYNGELTGFIQSSDDSMRDENDNGWASDTPVDQHFFKHNKFHPSDSTTFGHIEVVGIYSASGTYDINGNNIRVERGMSKHNLRGIFVEAEAGNIGRELDYTNCSPLPVESMATTVSSISPCSMQLMGEVIIGNAKDSNRASMRMTALGTDEGVEVNDEAVAALSYVITNPAFNATTSKETEIGQGFVLSGNGDNIVAIEAALAGARTSYEYEANATERTHTLIMFPTRYRHKKDDVCQAGGTFEVDQYTPPFNTDGSMDYAYTTLNNSEQGEIILDNPFSGGSPGEETETSFANEVNYDYKMANFAESGWASYIWRPTQGCDYEGAPVIGYSYKFISSGNVSIDAMLQKAPNTKF